MPVKPTYPGVYIEELPSGVRTITGVATSVAAFVDAFPRGLRDEAVQLFNMGDFETEYGGLNRDSAASYAVQQFFQNGGTEAWVVRVTQGGSVAAFMLTDQARVPGRVSSRRPPGGASEERRPKTRACGATTCTSRSITRRRIRRPPSTSV